MKQNITKEQWDELDDKQKLDYTNADITINNDYPNIGQMIEFLGDDFAQIQQLSVAWDDDDITGWEVSGNFRGQEQEELADALWEAVKEKLA